MKLRNKNSAPNFLIFFLNFSLQEDPGTWNYVQRKMCMLVCLPKSSRVEDP